MNMVYKKINYISWKQEAKRIVLSNDDMLAKLREIKANRQIAKSNTKRIDFTDQTYKAEIHGDYAELYLFEDGEYKIYCNNIRDNNKNSDTSDLRSVDRLFDMKFREFNKCSLRVAFGFVDKTLKRCIPKQFVYINKKYCDKLIKASSIDASSQYPSGCLGRLPDSHTGIYIEHYAEPTEEYPFAFYASGHCAEYGVFDTHNWTDIKLMNNLFRLDPNEDWPYRQLPKEKEHTILMKASQYTMDSTWQYFYNNKQNCPKDSEDYETAKLIMNKTIGCWHRKDANKKRLMTYDDHGSYQLAHIVAIAIGRGNQKILDMIEKIGLQYILHICVDGIIYMGDKEYGIDKPQFGKFSQEFTNADFMMRDVNVYCAKKTITKFKHGGYDLLDGKEIDESQDFNFDDLYKLSAKDRISEEINNG